MFDLFSNQDLNGMISQIDSSVVLVSMWLLHNWCLFYYFLASCLLYSWCNNNWVCCIIGPASWWKYIFLIEGSNSVVTFWVFWRFSAILRLLSFLVFCFKDCVLHSFLFRRDNFCLKSSSIKVLWLWYITYEFWNLRH